MENSYPFPLFVYPSLRCNYACSYCFTRSGSHQPAESFLLANWSSLLEQAVDLRVPEIRLSGGEPLMISQIESMCNAISGHGLLYTVMTNGSMLRKQVSWLRNNPPETLWLSFHAEYESRSQFIRLAQFAAAELPKVGAHVLNMDADPTFLQEIAIAGARRLKVLALTPIGRSADRANKSVTHNNSPLRWSVEEAHSLAQKIGRAVGSNVEVRFEASVLEKVAAGPSSCALRIRPLLSIGSDGRVYECCVTVGSAGHPIGDLRLDSLAQIVSRVQHGTGQTLPCESLLPDIRDGTQACPLTLIDARREPLPTYGS